VCARGACPTWVPGPSTSPLVGSYAHDPQCPVSPLVNCGRRKLVLWFQGLRDFRSSLAKTLGWTRLSLLVQLLRFSSWLGRSCCSVPPPLAVLLGHLLGRPRAFDFRTSTCRLRWCHWPHTDGHDGHLSRPRGYCTTHIQQVVWCCRLTIVGGVRDAPAAWRLGRPGTVCARFARPALLCGPSTSPLGVNLEASS
jgi:hypothetical protein